MWVSVAGRNCSGPRFFSVVDLAPTTFPPPATYLSVFFISFCSKYILPKQAARREGGEPNKTTAKKHGPLKMFALRCSCFLFLYSVCLMRTLSIIGSVWSRRFKVGPVLYVETLTVPESSQSVSSGRFQRMIPVIFLCRLSSLQFTES